MIISLNWLKKFTNINLEVEDLAVRIGARLVEIESIEELQHKYQEVVVARVVSCKKHEDSDHLSVVMLDDAGAADSIERDQDGFVQVVCGAPNIREGLTVAWLPPGATVPETFGTKEPFVLGARKLRGVVSNGMIASARELDLFDEHDGILELSDAFSLGKTFIASMELDDVLFDIENKSLTHRPDCFGIIGFAREVAAIQGETFATPDWLKNLTLSQDKKDFLFEAPRITLDETVSPRYQAVVLKNADATKKSPLEIQHFLARVGVRPINAVVDVTNYLMMLTGQPLHTYDYDKLEKLGGADISVRLAHQDEKLELIDGKTVTMSSEDIVIAAHDQPIGLAGAMGGANSEIDSTTKNILLEAATFDLYRLRATQMRHGVFSEAMTRFTKGQPAQLGAPVLQKAIELLGEWAGAEQVSPVGDAHKPFAEIQVHTSRQKINDILGATFSHEEIISTLRRVEFTVAQDGEEYLITPPYWRTDIHIPEDIIEEVGRLNGFDEISPELPLRDFSAVAPDSMDKLRTKIRQSLVKTGANEVLTYSFVHGDLLKKVGQDPMLSYRITNSISPDLQYYRQSLVPSLATLVYPNIKQGFDEFCLFELNKTHSKTNELNDEGVPVELQRIGLVYASKNPAQGASFFKMKQFVEQLGQDLGLKLEYKPMGETKTLAITAPFLPARTARIIDSVSGQVVGVIGEFAADVRKNLKLPEYSAGAELITAALLLATQQSPQSNYVPLSRFPGTSRDICFVVENDVCYQQIIDAAEVAQREIDEETHCSLIDIYQAEMSETKKITVRVAMVSHKKTLQNADATQIVEKIAAAVCDATNATIE